MTTAATMANDRHDPAGATPRPWYREPLVWLVIALPATAVIAGLTTVVIATAGRDVLVRDDFRKEGLSIHPDPRRDQAAVAVGARAELALDGQDGAVDVVLSLADAGREPRGLVLILSHATRTDLDRLVRLSRDGAAWRGRTAPFPEGHWYVELTPADRAWRLTGEFRGAGARLALEPGRAR